MRSILFSIIFLGLSLSASAQVLRKKTTMLMGSRWQFSIVAADSLSAEQHIQTLFAEVARIENLISDWKPESQVSINSTIF
jgi:thiamine biosynthesis lipoprotein